MKECKKINGGSKGLELFRGYWGSDLSSISSDATEFESSADEDTVAAAEGRWIFS